MLNHLANLTRGPKPAFPVILLGQPSAFRFVASPALPKTECRLAFPPQHPFRIKPSSWTRPWLSCLEQILFSI